MASIKITIPPKGAPRVDLETDPRACAETDAELRAILMLLGAELTETRETSPPGQPEATAAGNRQKNRT